MAFKVANTVVINDAGTITGLADGFNVNNRLVFCEGRIFQGTLSGYTSGGNSPVNTVDKFPFLSDTNASDVGDLTQARYGAAGQSSATSGYSSGGNLQPSGSFDQPSDTVDKFPFATDNNATDVGELTQSRGGASGQSSRINGFGYASGGQRNAPPTVRLNTVDKFPFTSDTNATDVGDLTVQRCHSTGQSSETHGYASGGRIVPANCNTVDKFPFSSDTNAVDAADLTVAREAAAGHSSAQSGYSAGGAAGATVYNVIDKFPFATDSNATDVGDLSRSTCLNAGQSSTLSGYTSGGGVFSPNPALPTKCNTIDKFSFTADANATDVGDLTQVREGAAGQQV